MSTTDMTTEQALRQLPGEVLPLVATIMDHSARKRDAITQELWQAEQGRRRQAQATLELAREQAGQLLAGPWMPVPERLLAALYPAASAVDERARQIAAREGS